MSSDRLDRTVQRLVAAVQAHSRSLEEMDQQGAERHAAMMLRLLEAVMAREEGVRSLRSLMEHAAPEVRGVAALHLLPHDSAAALEVLRQLALLPGLMGFRASVALERWERGELGNGSRDEG